MLETERKRVCERGASERERERALEKDGWNRKRNVKVKKGRERENE